MKSILLVLFLCLSSICFAYDDDTILISDHGNLIPVKVDSDTPVTIVGDTQIYRYSDTMTGINNPDGSQTFIYNND